MLFAFGGCVVVAQRTLRMSVATSRRSICIYRVDIRVEATDLVCLLIRCEIHCDVMCVERFIEW